MSEDRFLLEVQKRKVIYESLYVNTLNTTVDFMIARPEDEALVFRYVNEIAIKSKLLAGKKEELLYTESIKSSLADGLVILATDCFEICGLIIGKIIDFNKNFSNSDKSIQNELEVLALKSLKGECQKCLNVQVIGVSSDYKKSGIEERLWKEMLKLGKLAELNVIYASLLDFPSEIDLSFNGISTISIPISSDLKLFVNGNNKFVNCDLSMLDDYLADEKPSLPDAYKLPKIERKLVTEIYAKRLGRSIRYEIGRIEDAEAIKMYLRNEYFRQTMITRTLQCRKEDGDALLKRFKPENLEQKLTILAIDEGKICGLMINERCTIDNNVNPGPKFPHDFTKQIDQQPFTHIGGKTVIAMGTWMNDFIRSYIPKEYDDYFYLNMLSVHPHLRGCKIGWTLWIESMKLGHQAGYRFSQTKCTAISSNKIALDSGMKKVLTIEYGKVRYNGKHLFEDGIVFDGGREISMYVGDLKEIFSTN